jgi:DnaJ-domain-containing protein 1
VSTNRWDRLRERTRRKRDDDGPDPEDDTVDLSADEHAWWATRDHLEGTPKRGPEPPPDPKKSAFEQYFSTESLFTWGPDAIGADGTPVREPDPYEVLGVDQSAGWEQITAAHRRLAKEYHPDRVGAATDADRAEAEQRMRELNIAYSELRRRRGR